MSVRSWRSAEFTGSRQGKYFCMIGYRTWLVMRHLMHNICWRSLLFPFTYFPSQRSILLPLVTGVFRIEIVNPPYNRHFPNSFQSKPICDEISENKMFVICCRSELQESRPLICVIILFVLCTDEVKIKLYLLCWRTT